ncbi:hypothetical protein DFH06DRAFT_1344476 [Mycena polygramma]|nr:hypothetical protein DFH06DRAFT_1344476 [Mycena polygramma]
MSNPIAFTSIIFWVLSLIVPSSILRYAALSLAILTLTIYMVNCQLPTHKLAQVEDTIQVTDTTLKTARAECAWDHVELIEDARQLLEAKVSVSDIQSRLLKTHDIAEWKEYLHEIKEILQSIDNCAKEMRRIRTSTLLTVEAQRRRQLAEGMNEIDTVICSAKRYAQRSIRRLRPASTAANGSHDAHM